MLIMVNIQLLVAFFVYSNAFSLKFGTFRHSAKGVIQSTLRPINRLLSDSVLRSTKSEEAVVSTTKDGADFALLFDCDGVIVETEELHRLAYNKAFEKFGLQLPDGTPVNWDIAYYDKLQNTVGGGKPKMNYYFNNDAKAWPVGTTPERAVPNTPEEKVQLVDELQDAKTEFYIKIVQEVATPRPGVLELMDEAISDPKLKVGICSAATKAGFEKIVNSVVGIDRLNKLDIIIAGDDVKAKKPDPMIYNIARERLNMSADRCIVIEDSMVGLRAATAAGMPCIVSYTPNTAGEDFYGSGASATVPDLGKVTLSSIFGPLRAGNKQVLKGLRDPSEEDKAEAKEKAKMAIEQAEAEAEAKAKSEAEAKAKAEAEAKAKAEAEAKAKEEAEAKIKEKKRRIMLSTWSPHCTTLHCELKKE